MRYIALLLAFVSATSYADIGSPTFIELYVVNDTDYFLSTNIDAGQHYCLHNPDLYHITVPPHQKCNFIVDWNNFCYYHNPYGLLSFRLSTVSGVQMANGHVRFEGKRNFINEVKNKIKVTDIDINPSDRAQAFEDGSNDTTAYVHFAYSKLWRFK